MRDNVCTYLCCVAIKVPAFCERTRQALYRAAVARGYVCHEMGTAIVIQGPMYVVTFTKHFLQINLDKVSAYIGTIRINDECKNMIIM